VKATVNTAAGVVEWKDWPTPEPGPGQVRVRTACCGICATDLEMIAGWPRTGFPVVPGHEWSGVVEALGPGVDRALLGAPCVAENVLADGSEVGFEHPGGYGEYIVTEARNVRVLPAGFDLAAAALIEPLAVCVHGLKRLSLGECRSAVVIGDGPIGLLLLPLLKAARVERVCCIGGRPSRLALARGLGADCMVNYHEHGGDAAAAVRAALGCAPAGVIEASGSAKGMLTALDCAAAQARVLIIGDYGNRQDLVDWNTVLHKELTLAGSNASAGAWDEAVRLAVGGAVPLARLVTAVMPARRCAEAVELVRTARDVVKVVIDWRMK